MTNKRATTAPADEPDQAPPAAEPKAVQQQQAHVVELLPSIEGNISALASAGAPFVFFDCAPFLGLDDGVGSITLTARRQMSMNAERTGASTDHVAVMHLRGSLRAMRELRFAIDRIEDLSNRQAEAALAQMEKPTGPAH